MPFIPPYEVRGYSCGSSAGDAEVVLDIEGTGNVL
jgi:hypothetical protein